MSQTLPFTHVVILFPTMLLTLDETTLFFYSYRAKSVAVKESHDRFNKWLTDYIHTPQDNTGIDKRSAGGSSKRSVPSSRGGNSKVTSTAVDSLISHTDVAQSDIIIEIDDDSDVPAFEEDQKIERDAARNSPLKHGKRLSSKVRSPNHISSSYILTSTTDHGEGCTPERQQQCEDSEAHDY